MEAPKALFGLARLCEALDRCVEGDDVDDLRLKALLQPLALLQEPQPALGLLCVRARQQQQVQHEGGDLVAELSEDGLCCIHILERHICPEVQNVVLGIDVGVPVPLQHARCPLVRSDLESCVDEAGVHDLVRGDAVSENGVRGEACAEVLPAGKHLEGRLPELQGRQLGAPPHGPQHTLHHINLPDTNGGLDEGRIEVDAEVPLWAIPLKAAVHVQRPRELPLLKVPEHLLLRCADLGMRDGLVPAAFCEDARMGGVDAPPQDLRGVRMRRDLRHRARAAAAQAPPRHVGEEEDAQHEQLLGESRNCCDGALLEQVRDLGHESGANECHVKYLSIHLVERVGVLHG
mmetsp:Transcript_107741/g.300260  ORF Transcript_107741/g.300260 Transcript_107741/m.300260 type:complete len:347 (+) Transcript_107741:1051-2091(+)